MAKEERVCTTCLNCREPIEGNIAYPLRENHPDLFKKYAEEQSFVCVRSPFTWERINVDVNVHVCNRFKGIYVTYTPGKFFDKTTFTWNDTDGENHVEL